MPSAYWLERMWFLSSLPYMDIMANLVNVSTTIWTSFVPSVTHENPFFFKFCFYLLSDLGTSHVWNCWNMSDLWSCWHQLTWLFLCLGLGQIITLSADAQTSSCTYLVRYIIPAFIPTTSDVFKKYYVLESNTDISTKKASVAIYRHWSTGVQKAVY